MYRFVPFALFTIGCANSGLGTDLQFADDARRDVTCTDIFAGEEGERADWGVSVTAERAACQSASHAVEGPAGATLEVQLNGWEGAASLEQRDWNGETLGAFGLQAGESLQLEVPFAGEHLLVLLPEGSSDIGGSYTLSVTCVAGCDTAYSRYPFFFMHGMGSPMPGDTEFVEIEETLHQAGYVAWAPVVSAWADTFRRASEWRTHLDAWRSDGTWRRVHLVGHSMGGIDARTVATHYDPEQQVATVTTVASPHRGAFGADIMVGANDTWILGWMLDEATQVLSNWVGAPGEQDFAEQMDRLSTAGMDAFNFDTPNRSDVHYRSWAGATCSVIAWDCRSALQDEVVDFTMEATLVLTNLYGLPNDGLVDIDSARWGAFQGVLPADHLDLNGRTETDGPFDHYTFYVREAGRLAAWERGESPEPEPLVVDVTDL